MINNAYILKEDIMKILWYDQLNTEGIKLISVDID